ncbi:MAG: nucleotidyltransferase family protein [Pseudomonadota bacterium]
MSCALILAAGRGERLRPLTDATPKPLISDGQDALIDRHLRALAAAGVTQIVINLGWLGERITAHVGDGARFGVSVQYSNEGYPTLDTGGAIVRALPLLGTAPFWVVNADIHTDFAFDRSAQALLGEYDAAIGLIDNPGYRERGDFNVVDGMATNEPLMTFAGVALYRPAFFESCEAGRFSVVPLLRDAANLGVLRAFELNAVWADVGTPDRLADIRRQVTG